MNKKTILIADYDRDLCQTLALRCRRHEIESIIANDGTTAIRLAESLAPALICLDVDMLGGNGLAVCEVLQVQELFADTPFVIITGCDDIETVARCKRRGAKYVPKFGPIWSRIDSIILDLLKVRESKSKLNSPAHGL